MAFLIDSGVLIELERARQSVDAIREPAGDAPIFIAAITASELLHGVHRADGVRRRARRSRFVEAVLETLPVLPFDLGAARIHAEIWADLKRRGSLIGAHDMLIAATALQHGLELATKNRREFERIDGLELANWEL